MEIDGKLLVQLGLAALFTCLFFIVQYTKRRRESNGGPPEAAGAWPVIGHLHRLGPVHQLHRQLGAMADDLGPAFLLRLGLRRTLVVSSRSAARDCFTAANDMAFSSRPDSAAARLMGYDRAMFGFAPYGPYWRAIRKIATVRLLSVSRLNSLRHIRAGEIDRRVKALFSSSGVKIDLKKWCGDLTMDVMARMVVGRSVIGDDNDGCDGRRFREAISRFFYLITVFLASDAVPWRVMDWVDFRGYKRMMRETAAEMDEVLAGWLAEHRRRREAAGGGPAEEEDFMDVMLGAMDGGEIEGCDSDTVIKATCMVSFFYILILIRMIFFFFIFELFKLIM